MKQIIKSMMKQPILISRKYINYSIFLLPNYLSQKMPLNAYYYTYISNIILADSYKNQYYTMDYDAEFEDENFYNEDYQYEYGDEGYNDFQIQTTQLKFRILPQSQLFNQVVLKIANQCQTITAFPIGWSILLLRDFKWQIGYVPEYYQDVKKHQQKIKYSESFKLPSDPDMQKVEIGQCLVCCGTGHLIMNICGESFCENCWLEQVKAQFSSMNPFVCCMSCSAPVLYETMLQIINLSSQKKKLQEKYQKLICQEFTTVNNQYQCCPGVDCTYCIKRQGYNVTTVKCNCGKMFCFQCKNDDHSPCTCEEKKKWENMVMKQEADAKWMALNTKLCPWCNKAVERSAGCNYMACLCGKSFCYMCSKPWEPDHKDHFKCHIYKKKDNVNVDKQKAILEKMNFYADKYLNTNAVVAHLKKVDTFQKRRVLFETLGVDLTQSDFIDQAYCFAIECLEGLKWIYVYRYYAKFSCDQKKQVFQFSQGQYEKYKQQLLKKLSFDLKKFLKQIEDRFQEYGSINNYDKQKFLNEYVLLKKNIINYFTCTKQFKQKFMEEIQKIEPILTKKYSQDKGSKKQSGSKKENPGMMSKLRSWGSKK